MKNKFTKAGVAFMLAASTLLTSCKKRDVSSYEGRIADVAAQKQFTALMDANHYATNILKLCVSEDTIKGLKEAGVKHIFPEIVPAEMIPVIDLYMTGKVGRPSLKFYFDEVLPLLNKDSPIPENTRTEIYMNLIDNCKKHGLALHAGDHHEGHYTETEFPAYRDYVAGLSKMLVFTHNGNPGTVTTKEQASQFMGFIEQEFVKMSPDVAANYKSMNQTRNARMNALKAEILAKPEMRAALAKELGEKGLMKQADSIAIQGGLINETIANNLVRGWVTLERVRQDEKVAARIQKTAGTDKAAIIYGAGHFYRAEGDIDFHLGSSNVTTIRVFSEGSPLPFAAEKTQIPQIQNYSFDVDSGTWMAQGSTNKTTLAMPAGFVTRTKAPAGPALQ